MVTTRQILQITKLYGTNMNVCNKTDVYCLYVTTEPPVTFLKTLEDIRRPEGAVVSIECELSRHNVEVKWMKVRTQSLS